MKKIKYIFTTLLIVFVSSALMGQKVVGVWKTIDDETGKEKSYVKIYKKGNKIYGDVYKILDESKKNNLCTACEGDKKNKKVMGMTIIEGLEADGNDFGGGTILDPNNGKVYDCTIWVDEDGDLQVRGYIGWFFRTQTWKRIN